MKKQSHTPGPWHILRMNGQTGVEIGKYMIDVKEADARLIAATPDGHEILAFLSRFSDDGSNEVSFGALMDDSDLTLGEALKNYFAKVNGGKPSSSNKVEITKGVKIVVNDPIEFCRMYWDTYNFDYDKETLTANSVFAWPLDGTVNELIKELREAGIVCRAFEKAYRTDAGFIETGFLIFLTVMSFLIVLTACGPQSKTDSEYAPTIQTPVSVNSVYGHWQNTSANYSPYGMPMCLENPDGTWSCQTANDSACNNAPLFEGAVILGVEVWITDSTLKIGGLDSVSSVYQNEQLQLNGLTIGCQLQVDGTMILTYSPGCSVQFAKVGGI